RGLVLLGAERHAGDRHVAHARRARDLRRARPGVDGGRVGGPARRAAGAPARDPVAVSARARRRRGRYPRPPRVHGGPTSRPTTRTGFVESGTAISVGGAGGGG